MRNMSMALLLAHGIPMIYMGDEYGHSKMGNNNTYCHDNELNWFDWQAAVADESGFSRFMRQLIKLRRSRPELQRATYVNSQDVQWHGDLPSTPDWSQTSRLVAYTLTDGAGGGLFVAFNAAHVPRILSLPTWQGQVWQPLVDTSQVAPYDFLLPDEVSCNHIIMISLTG
jgi:isoamylase